MANSVGSGPRLASVEVKSSTGLLKIFQPEPPAAYRITDPETVRSSYKKYQRDILIATMIGYAAFYFVRKNLSVAMPLMEQDLGITKVSLGLFLTLHGILYGVSKFVNGFLGDRSNARVFMVTGLGICALLNVAFAASAAFTHGLTSALFGFSAMAWTLGLIWMANGWFQGMGFPPCARLLTHWFPPRILATRMSLWNISHSVGAAGVVALGGLLVKMGYGWRSMFYVPAAIAVLICIYLWMSLKDTPESLGLPPVESLDAPTDAAVSDTVDPETAESLYESLEEKPQASYMKKVFQNPYIWIFAIANFFVYTVRYAIFDWSPTVFKEAKGFDLSHAAWISATFEIAGIFGMLTAGWLTDNLFGGRGARTCLFYMAGCTLSVFLLWKLPLTSGVGYTLMIFHQWEIPVTSGVLAATVMALSGFCIYGPQALVGIAVANLATKHAAATAVGLTGLFGYLSGIVSGVGVGYIAQKYGWHMFFEAICGFSLMGTMLFALAWFAPAHGYSKSRRH